MTQGNPEKRKEEQLDADDIRYLASHHPLAAFFPQANSNF